LELVTAIFDNIMLVRVVTFFIDFGFISWSDPFSHPLRLTREVEVVDREVFSLILCR
jgi:hypothetical protein